MDKAERETEEILVELGFIEPEELESEIVELLREHARAIERFLENYLTEQK